MTAWAAGWRVEVSPCRGCHAARQGSEIHVQFQRPGVITRRKVREFLGPMLDELGFLTTRVELGDHGNARFVERLGFEPTWSDDKYRYFMLTRAPFSRRGQCPQQSQ